MGNMDTAEVEESVFAVTDAKLHGGMCKKLSSIVCKVMAIFPLIEEARPRCKSGIQALCSLHLALEKSKSLLQHCADCSKLYLAITGDSVLLKFEKAKRALEDSLNLVEDIVPQATGCQIMAIVSELQETVFTLDQQEKQVGDDVIALLQQDRSVDSSSDDKFELEAFHQAALKLGITSSRAALTERRALKKLIEKAHWENDPRKGSIVSYLLHLMRKYSKLFRNECGDDVDSQGSTPRSPTTQFSLEDSAGSRQTFVDQLSKIVSFDVKSNGRKSGNLPIIPEEFRCPISLQLMYDPVIISSGQTYERVCIEKWFSDGHDTCPKTQQKLSHLFLTPNYCVKALITTWCEQNGVSHPEHPRDSLDLGYWRLTSSGCENTKRRSRERFNSGHVKPAKVVPLEYSEGLNVSEKHEETAIQDIGFRNIEMDPTQRYTKMLTSLNSELDVEAQCRAVEEIRLLLKDDEEARLYMGEKGLVDALVKFLKTAVHLGNDKYQESGALALFNLGVNNDRNKKLMVDGGVLPLLEEIQQSSAFEAATALYLNLSCFDEAKAIIGSSSKAIPFLVSCLQQTKRQCKLDALQAVYSLSTLPSNIPLLLSAGAVLNLATSILSGSENSCPEKVIAVLCNLASTEQGKAEVMMCPSLIGFLACTLDCGTQVEQELAVSFLLTLCVGDEKCSQLVLQEGIVPSLVSISINGTPGGQEKALKLLMHFREMREQEEGNSGPETVGTTVTITTTGNSIEEPQPKEVKQLSKTKTKRLGKSLKSMCKLKLFSIYQCQ